MNQDGANQWESSFALPSHWWHSVAYMLNFRFVWKDTVYSSLCFNRVRVQQTLPWSTIWVQLMKHLFIQCKTELFFFARHVLFATATSIYIRSSGIGCRIPGAGWLGCLLQVSGRGRWFHSEPWMLWRPEQNVAWFPDHLLESLSTVILGEISWDPKTYSIYLKLSQYLFHSLASCEYSNLLECHNVLIYAWIRRFDQGHTTKSWATSRNLES